MWRCIGRSFPKICVNFSICLTTQKNTLAKLSSCSKSVKYNCLATVQNITYTPIRIPKNPISEKKLHYTIQRSYEEPVRKQDCNSFTYRTHTCGGINVKNVGQKITLCGWVQYVRMSKFLLLRDAYGITQCIVDGKNVILSNLSLESIVKIEGTVVLRPKNMINTKMTTGEVEVVISSVETLNIAEKVPFNLRDYQKPKEQLRLQHRYIDLRFPEMQSNLRQRSTMLHNIRRFLVENHNFVEVETPTLFCHTPGGAREFVVPTHHSGLFYALVQSPQQLKQILMSGGIDRYFQIARCYRDETTRPDRQPEFTQLDIELSFTSLDKVLTLVEDLLCDTFLKSLPKPPFKRITYKEALENYGTDKPNLSYDLKLHNIKHLFSDKVRERDFEAYALSYPAKLGNFTAEDKNKIDDLIRKHNTKIFINEVLLKRFGIYFNERLQEIIGEGNTAILSLGVNENASRFLGEFREYLAQLLYSKNLLTIKENIEPLWVVDFPLFMKGEEGLETCHHPFTAPHPDDLHLLNTDPLRVRSLAYDLVLNGNEVGGGSVRIHNVELQKKILKILNINTYTLTHFLNALSHGCPPHAGIALGIDRLVSLACGAESIRDVIAFPKTHDGRDPLSGAPNAISDEDKKYYHLTRK